ncbi:16402_t:CDS:2, partial [Acaulospora colombiana]
PNNTLSSASLPLRTHVTDNAAQKNGTATKVHSTENPTSLVFGHKIMDKENSYNPKVNNGNVLSQTNSRNNVIPIYNTPVPPTQPPTTKGIQHSNGGSPPVGNSMNQVNRGSATATLDSASTNSSNKPAVSIVIWVRCLDSCRGLIKKIINKLTRIFVVLDEYCSPIKRTEKNLFIEGVPDLNLSSEQSSQKKVQASVDSTSSQKIKMSPRKQLQNYKKDLKLSDSTNIDQNTGKRRLNPSENTSVKHP